MRERLTSIVATAILVTIAVRPEAGATPQTPGRAAPTSTRSVQDRLASVREDVFTRPDRLNAAVQELHQLLAIDPSLAEAHLLLGLAHASRRTPEMRAEAIAEFRQALEIEPHLTPARFYLAKTYLEMGLAERAREELTVALQDVPGSPQFVAVLAEVERQLGNPAQAIARARQALADDPASSEARYYLALAFRDAGRREEALMELERIGAAGAPRAEMLVTLGAMYLDAGRNDAAIAALTKSLSAGPALPEARLNLARAYRVSGQLARAEAELDLVLPPGTVMQASGYFQHLEADLLLERGLLHMARGVLATAAATITNALQIRPGLARAHRYLAEIYARQSQFAQAAEEARLAREGGAPAPEAVEAAIASRKPLVGKAPIP
jgi:tetratricopeptide (TPR) repeat protein